MELRVNILAEARVQTASTQRNVLNAFLGDMALCVSYTVL